MKTMMFPRWMEEIETLGELVTKAYTSRDVEDREKTSNTTNPVESINRQSFKSRNNMNVILENIYLEDRMHAVKMATSLMATSRSTLYIPIQR